MGRGPPHPPGPLDPSGGHPPDRPVMHKLIGALRAREGQLNRPPWHGGGQGVGVVVSLAGRGSSPVVEGVEPSPVRRPTEPQDGPGRPPTAGAGDPTSPTAPALW